jgi:hypothetical protein
VGNFQGRCQCSLNAMTVVDADPALARARNITGIFASLQREWDQTAKSPEASARKEEWAAAEPVLDGCAGLNGIVGLVTWQGRRPSPTGNRALAALLRHAADPLAARTLLQALLPRVRTERVLVPTYGHGVNEAWQRPADTIADLVAECFAAVKRHAGEDHDDVARLVLREATRKLRTARQVQRRYHQRTVVVAPDHHVYTEHGLPAARSGPEWLAAALTDAVRARRISLNEAQLVYGARVQGLPASEVGRRTGLAPKAVYYALAQAERALVRRVA